MDTEIVKEDLRKWFKDGGWNRYNTKGEKVGKCARDDKDGDGKADGPKPKCLPASKAASLGKKKVAAAVKRKRAEDPNPDRKGAAKNVSTESVVHEMISTSMSGKKYKSIDNPEDQARLKKEDDRKKAAKDRAGKARKEELAATRQTKGIKFYDAKGSGYIKGGKKVYEEAQQFMEKCWKGYEKKGMKTMFGKRYPNCVKKEEVTFQQFNEKAQKCWDTHKKVGMKMKGGKLVNNCVPKNEEVQVEGAAWTKKEGKNESGGLNEKGRKSYERENPGSDLKRPSKKVGNKRRASFCARMKGMRKRQKPSNNTGEDRLSKSLRAWNC
jgi:hypothetical protein